MSKNIPCEEIQHLKRANFWLCKDRIKVKSLIREKLDSVVELNKSMKYVEYRYYKDYTKQRNKLLDESSFLIDLRIRIDQDIYDNGIKDEYMSRIENNECVSGMNKVIGLVEKCNEM